MTTSIFVFGSNLAGRHGKGAALTARRDFGAVYGQGQGRQGNAYGVPTKDAQLRSLSLDRIRLEVNELKQYALNNQDLKFFVTRIGCGLAGYTDAQIAPMFRSFPANCSLPESWLPYL